jgi:ketosteroid isomerase-like protein
VPEQNVELVRAIIAAAPEWERVRSMLHPDVRLDQTRMPDGGVYHGRDAFGRFFQRWFGTWDDLRLTPERFIEDHERVLVLLRVEGRGKGSGVPVVIRAADVWTLRDGKVISLEGYPDRSEALEAFGLSRDAALD